MGAVYDNLTKNRVPEGGRKNYLINGNFDMWQYGTSQTSSGYGSDDRWANYNIGSTKTHSMVNSSDTERALFNSSKYSRTVVTSVAGAGNLVEKYQGIEDITKLAGKTITISFWAKADSSKNIAIDLSQFFGTGGTPSAFITGIGSQLVALTTIWQKKVITVTMPSIVGKTLGTDGTHTSCTYINFWFDAGSSWNSRTVSLGQQSGTFDIAEVKIEDGSVATDGWHPYDGEFGGEIQACARYLPKFSPISSWVGQAYGGNLAGFSIPFFSSTRIAPTGVLSSGGFNVSKGNGATTPVISFAFAIASINNGNINASLGSVFLTEGQASTLSSSGGILLFTGCEL
jgi:hypothetical protein